MSAVGTPEQVHTVSEEAAPPGPHARGGFFSLQSLLGTIVIAIFVITFIVQAFQIPSESMEKTLLIGDYLLVDKAHYGESHLWGWLMPYRPIRRQDIIVFRYPINPRQHFVKRIIAVPGDHLRLFDKHVYVNGVRQDDAYAVFNGSSHDPFRDDFPDGGFYGGKAKWLLQLRELMKNGELIVPAGFYFAMGDNRDDSYDSRYWGFVPRENIEGRPLVIYWSMGRKDAATAGSPPSGKLSSLTWNISRTLDSVRWRRVLRVPE